MKLAQIAAIEQDLNDEQDAPVQEIVNPDLLITLDEDLCLGYTDEERKVAIEALEVINEAILFYEDCLVVAENGSNQEFINEIKDELAILHEDKRDWEMGL